MDENLLRAQWSAKKAAHQAWGDLLKVRIMSALEQGGNGQLVRVTPSIRLKTDDSLVEKVFYRNPGKYADPWNEIEDFVGIRFIVLLERDIAKVREIVEGLNDVSSNVARDHKEIERIHPNAFDYASTHIICRPRINLEYGGVIIEAKTPCEIQIRTLLQHAWSEVSHNTLYKPVFEASDQMRRSAAKSSALIEATSDYFDLVYDEIAKKEGAMDLLTKQLTPIYRLHVKQDPSISGIEQQILDSYASLLTAHESENLSAQIGQLLESKDYISSRILERRSTYLVYKQPSILLIYWLVSRYPIRVASQEVGLPRHILSEIFTDLGKEL